MTSFFGVSVFTTLTTDLSFGNGDTSESLESALSSRLRLGGCGVGFGLSPSEEKSVRSLSESTRSASTGSSTLDWDRPEMHAVGLMDLVLGGDLGREGALSLLGLVGGVWGAAVRLGERVGL